MSTVDGTAEFVMTPEVLGIVPGAPLEVALRMMAEARMRHLPVVDRGRCVGLLHESDVLWRLWSTAGTVPPLVGAVVRRPTVVVDRSDDVHKVARAMVDAETDAAIVVENGRIAGIVTVTDLLHRLAVG